MWGCGGMLGGGVGGCCNVRVLPQQDAAPFRVPSCYVQMISDEGFISFFIFFSDKSGAFYGEKKKSPSTFPNAIFNSGGTSRKVRPGFKGWLINDLSCTQRGLGTFWGIHSRHLMLTAAF